MPNEVVSVNGDAAAEHADILANVFIHGDISKLTNEQKATYVAQICNRLGLDPYTQPFRILKQKTPSGTSEILYATKSCAEQLMAKHKISTEISEVKVDRTLGIATCKCEASLIGRSRVTSAMSAVQVATIVQIKDNPIPRLDMFLGETLCNALMKCETKATRRAVLRLMGLGMIDETETETIANSVTVSIPDHNALGIASGVDEDLQAAGQLTIGQRKEVIAWFEANGHMEAIAIYDEALKSQHPEVQETCEDKLVDLISECFEVLKFDLTQDAGNSATDALLARSRELARRKEAAQVSKDNRVPKGGKSQSPVKLVEGNGSPASDTIGGAAQEESKPAPKPKGNGKTKSVQDISSTPESASTAESSPTQQESGVTSEAPNVVNRASVPPLKALNGLHPKEEANGVGAGFALEEPADAEEQSGGVHMTPEVEKLYIAITDHIIARPSENPEWTRDAIGMLVPLFKAAKWEDKKASKVLSSTFGINTDTMGNPAVFTWDLLADMATFFAMTDPASYEVRK